MLGGFGGSTGKPKAGGSSGGKSPVDIGDITKDFFSRGGRSLLSDLLERGNRVEQVRVRSYDEAQTAPAVGTRTAALPQQQQQQPGASAGSVSAVPAKVAGPVIIKAASDYQQPTAQQSQPQQQQQIAAGATPQQQQQPTVLPANTAAGPVTIKAAPGYVLQAQTQAVAAATGPAQATGLVQVAALTTPAQLRAATAAPKQPASGPASAKSPQLLRAPLLQQFDGVDSTDDAADMPSPGGRGGGGVWGGFATVLSGQITSVTGPRQDVFELTGGLVEFVAEFDAEQLSSDEAASLPRDVPVVQDKEYLWVLEGDMP